MAYFIYKKNLQDICTYQLCWFVHENYGIIHSSRAHPYIPLEFGDNLWDEYIQWEDLTQKIDHFCQKNKVSEHTNLCLEEVQVIINSVGL